MENRLKRVGLAALAIVVLASGTAQADFITYNLSYKFSGTAPQGPAPWLTASFADIGSNVVRLTLTWNLTGSEFLGKKGWYFNFDDTLNLRKLTIAHESGQKAQDVNKYKNGFKADGDGYFDIEFGWSSSGSGRLTAGETATYLLSYSGNEFFSSGSFQYPSAPGGGHGTYLSAAHVQGIAGGESGWIGAVVVPVPGAVLLGVIGLGLVGWAKRRLA